MNPQITLVLAALQVAIGSVEGQVLMTGRLVKERAAGSKERMPLAGVTCFAALPGSEYEPRAFRTWEAEPAGWYRLSGPAGAYTLLFTAPAHWVRPFVLTNVFTRPGDKIDRVLEPDFDYAMFEERAWDERPASHYYQTFKARGASITHVGFKPFHDGIDGMGTGAQDMLVSIHRKGAGTPDNWEQIGPAMLVPQVDRGGPKNYSFSAGWNSGEVPTTPGEVYAVHLRAKDPAGVLQTWWSKPAAGEEPPSPPLPREGKDADLAIAGSDAGTDCYRIGPGGESGWQGRDMWMAIAGDSDALLIPYNKRVHRQFREFAGGGRKWAQTYVAQGRGLAGVILYAAVGTAEPPLSRQRCRVRVHRGAPDGPVIGIEKLAIGNGNYTGDASWGVFGTVYAPGETPLEPGQTYAVEFESIENYETLHGFTNIKGAVSQEKPGFNPYRKVAPDVYEKGTAFADGSMPTEFDLDMQIIEYRNPSPDWAHAVGPENLLKEGGFESLELPAATSPTSGPAQVWRIFTLDPATRFERITEGKQTHGRAFRVIGGGPGGGTVDGGCVQRVEALSHVETYRLSGQVRCSWPADVDRALMVGYDPTGQAEDARAATIEWTELPPLHGHWMPYRSDPIRPVKDAISIWLRGRATVKTDYPFKADFNNFSLLRVLQ